MDQAGAVAVTCDYYRKETGATFGDTVKCKTDAMRKHLMPVYQNKALLLALIADWEEIGLKVDEGGLSEGQAQVEMQRAEARFTEAESQISRNAQSARAAAMSQVGQALINANQPTDNRDDQNFKTTNCNFSGNTVHCTEF
ncbi:MAG: hypothetical protein CL535_19460 [Ahrensia sp.]|nr:hypothetical protein [Ahrensia sp.]